MDWGPRLTEIVLVRYTGKTTNFLMKIFGQFALFTQIAQPDLTDLPSLKTSWWCTMVEGIRNFFYFCLTFFGVKVSANTDYSFFISKKWRSFLHAGFFGQSVFA